MKTRKGEGFGRGKGKCQQLKEPGGCEVWCLSWGVLWHPLNFSYFYFCAWGQPITFYEFWSSPGNSLCSRCVSNKRSWTLLLCWPWGTWVQWDKKAKMLLETGSEPHLGSSWQAGLLNVSKPHSSLCPHLANRVKFIGICRQNALCFPFSAWKLLEIPRHTTPSSFLLTHHSRRRCIQAKATTMANCP